MKEKILDVDWKPWKRGEWRATQCAVVSTDMYAGRLKLGRSSQEVRK